MARASVFTGLIGQPVQTALAAVIVLGFIYFLLRKTASDVAEATGLSARGTAFEGAGAVGVLGNITNKLSGGTLAAVGSKISEYFVPAASDRRADIFYTYTLPNGDRHAVSALDVDDSGFFFYKGTRYRLALDTSGKRIAVG